MHLDTGYSILDDQQHDQSEGHRESSIENGASSRPTSNGKVKYTLLAKNRTSFGIG